MHLTCFRWPVWLVFVIKVKKETIRYTRISKLGSVWTKLLPFLGCEMRAQLGEVRGTLMRRSQQKTGDSKIISTRFSFPFLNKNECPGFENYFGRIYCLRSLLPSQTDQCSLLILFSKERAIPIFLEHIHFRTTHALKSYHINGIKYHKSIYQSIKIHCII